MRPHHVACYDPRWLQAKRRSGLRKVHLVLDGLVVAAAAVLAFGLHALLRDSVPALKEVPPFQDYALLAYLTLPLWLLLVAALGLHRSFERVWSRAELFVDLVKLHLAGLVGLAVVAFATQGVINRSLVAMFLGCSLALMYLQRGALGLWVRFQHERGHGRTRVLLVGWPSERMAAFVRDARADELPPLLVGYLGAAGDAPALAAEGLDLEQLGEVGELGRLLHDRAVDQVVFFAPFNRPELAPEALATCEELGVHASYAVDLVQLSRAVPHIEFAYDHPFIAFDVAPKRPEALSVKHGIDFVAAALGLLVLAPFLLLVALAILVTMGRPIFFAQERAGLFGRSFRMLKFRTMVVGAEQQRDQLADRNEMAGPVFKVTDDPRVTRLGRLLRRTSIDELPQLFNVLAGTMSLVGPRPLPIGEQKEIRGWQRRRLSMKPGITGLWQVSGRNDVDFEEWMALDLQYVDSWSLGADLRILLKTLPAMLSGRGAK